MSEPVDPFRDWDAAYVLGALDADDRRAFERHLSVCPACAAAVTELAGIPGILGKIDADAAVGLSRSEATTATTTAATTAHTAQAAQLGDSRHLPDLVQRLARTARRRQRRNRRWLAAGSIAAAAALIVAGIVTGTAIHPTGDAAGTSSGTSVAMSQIQPNALTADLRVTGKPWGTRFDWSCVYGSSWLAGRASQSYDLVVTDASGAQTTIATWNAAGPKAVGLTASSGIPLTDIRTVEIRASGAAVPLVRGRL